MALLKFKYGPSANLATKGIEDGVIYITTDSQEMKVDIGSTRYNISDFMVVETQAALEALGTYYENLFYYVKADNLLKKYIKTPAEGESNWININDTSALDDAVATIGARLVTAESDIGNKIEYPYMSLRHCPMKSHLGATCDKCPYKDGFIYRMDNGKILKLKRKKLSTCTFYLV